MNVVGIVSGIEADRQKDRLLGKVHNRIAEDFAFIYADFCEAIIGANASGRATAVESLVLQRLDIMASWHLFLVPMIMPADFSKLIGGFADEVVTANLSPVPPLVRARLHGRVSYWTGRAFERSRTMSASAVPILPSTTPRVIIGRWMKEQKINDNASAAKHLAIGETVLAALKRGAALSEKRCGRDTVERVAGIIGCVPEALEPEFSAAPAMSFTVLQ